MPQKTVPNSLAHTLLFFVLLVYLIIKKQIPTFLFHIFNYCVLSGISYVRKTSGEKNLISIDVLKYIPGSALRQMLAFVYPFVPNLYIYHRLPHMIKHSDFLSSTLSSTISY